MTQSTEYGYVLCTSRLERGGHDQPTNGTIRIGILALVRVISLDLALLPHLNLDSDHAGDQGQQLNKAKRIGDASMLSLSVQLVYEVVYTM